MNYQTIFLTKDRITDIKNDTIGIVCSNSCSYTGSILVGNIIKDCSCLIEFKKRINFLGAEVPEKYWDFTYANLLGDFKEENHTTLATIKVFSDKLAEMTLGGYGLYIQGASGLAKSALAAYIVKAAIRARIVSYFTSMPRLSKLILDANKEAEAKTKLQ